MGVCTLVNIAYSGCGASQAVQDTLHTAYDRGLTMAGAQRAILDAVIEAKVYNRYCGGAVYMGAVTNARFDRVAQPVDSIPQWWFNGNCLPYHIQELNGYFGRAPYFEQEPAFDDWVPYPLPLQYEYPAFPMLSPILIAP